MYSLWTICYIDSLSFYLWVFWLLSTGCSDWTFRVSSLYSAKVWSLYSAKVGYSVRLILDLDIILKVYNIKLEVLTQKFDFACFKLKALVFPSLAIVETSTCLVSVSPPAFCWAVWSLSWTCQLRGHLEVSLCAYYRCLL